MYATELCVDPWPGVDFRRIRWELFVHRSVLDVLPTSSRTRFVVIHSHEAEPERWRSELVAAGLARATGS